MGLYSGGTAIIPIHKNFFLQPELIYSTKGYSSYNQGGPNNLVTRFNYINIPVLLGYAIDKKTYLMLGPEVGYLTSAHFIISDASNINVSDNYPSKFDAALDIGLSYKLFRKLGIEIRYAYGLRTLYYVDGLGIRHSETNGANRAFQLGLYYIVFK